MKTVKINTASRYHPKIKRLKEQLGAEGVLALYTLWAFCADCKPDGRFTRMLWQDVVRVSGYQGEGNGIKKTGHEFIQCLLELRLLEYDGSLFSIHDWDDYNPGIKPKPIRTESPPRSVNNRKVGYHPGSKEFSDGPQEFDF